MQTQSAAIIHPDVRAVERLIRALLALPHLSPLASGLGLLIQPILSAAMGWIWFEEGLTLLEVTGMTAILLALILVRVPERRGPASMTAE